MRFHVKIDIFCVGIYAQKEKLYKIERNNLKTIVLDGIFFK